MSVINMSLCVDVCNNLCINMLSHSQLILYVVVSEICIHSTVEVVIDCMIELEKSSEGNREGHG